MQDTLRALSVVEGGCLQRDSAGMCPGGGGYSYIFLYGDVPLNRVSFSGLKLIWSLANQSSVGR